MATQPGKYRDVLFSTDSVSGLVGWFDALDPQWRGWNDGADGPRGFREGIVAVKGIRAGQDWIGIVRMLKADYDALVSRDPPRALFDVYAQADPYAVIPEGATQAEAMERISVVWKVRHDPVKVARVREFFPLSQPVYDAAGNPIGFRQVGLMLSRFDPRWPDVFGDGET